MRLCHLQSPGDGIQVCVTGRVTHVGSVIRLSPGPGRGRPGRRRRFGDDYRRDRPGLGPVSRTRAGPTNRDSGYHYDGAPAVTSSR